MLFRSPNRHPGWALLQDNGGVATPGFSSYGEVSPVLQGVSGYQPLAMARLLASGASQAYVRNTGAPVGRYLTTNANTAPIVNLRNGHLLNFAGWANGDYAGPVTLLAPNPLPFICTPVLKGWPGVYHACGNGNGFHWLNDVSKFVNSDVANEPMQLLVR